MNIKRYVSIILGLMVAVVLSGCASTQQTSRLSSAARAHICTVAVDPNIPVPNSAEYGGRSMVGARIFGGLVGMGIAYAAESHTRDALMKAVNRRGIKLNQLLYQSFVADVKNQTNFRFVSGTSYDAQFKLDITSFGFVDKMNSKTTMPFVDVTGQLMDKQGNIVWQSKKEEFLDDKAYAGYGVKDYIKNRVLMKKAFNALMAQSSDDLVSTLMY